jgi:hypothetical protein
MNMRPICVFGVLLTDEGKKIKAEMLEWLEPIYEVHLIEQEPPGKLFEYPAIKEAIELSIERNLPVLYIHTKGAGNPVRGTAPCPAYPVGYRAIDCMPSNRCNEDWQGCVRNMWKHEFTENRDKYFEAVNVDHSMVACPYHSKNNRITWQNAFVMNPQAAVEVKETFIQTTNRYYYECIFDKTKVGMVGIRLNDIPDDPNVRYNTMPMNRDIWTF